MGIAAYFVGVFPGEKISRDNTLYAVHYCWIDCDYSHTCNHSIF